jgi:hypothetical protein
MKRSLGSGFFFEVCLVTFAVLAAACSSDPPTAPDGGAPIDATLGLDRVADGTASDAAIDLSSNDAPPIDATIEPDATSDAGCACARVDAGIPLGIGAIPLPCFCGMTSWPVTFTRRPACSTYDAVMSCPDGGFPFYVQTYASCNLLVVQFGVHNAVDYNVYDATTHELVGAMRADDYPSQMCGADRVNALQAGVVPGPECELTKTEQPCRPSDGGDAGPPISDADAGCACTTDGSGTGEQSLACFCASGSDACPTYDEARTRCELGARQQFNRIDVHAACNLVVMTAGNGFGGATQVFDATTHELVGASRFTDVNVLACGSARVFGYRAGIFPPANCPVSQSVSRCPADGGGAPEGGDASDAGCPCD